MFDVFVQVRLKPACSAIKTIWRLEISDLAKSGIILSKKLTTNVLLDCANAQADLHLCCSHMLKTDFLKMRLRSVLQPVALHSRTWSLNSSKRLEITVIMQCIHVVQPILHNVPCKNIRNIIRNNSSEVIFQLLCTWTNTRVNKQNQWIYVPAFNCFSYMNYQ